MPVEWMAFESTSDIFKGDVAVDVFSKVSIKFGSLRSVSGTSGQKSNTSLDSYGKVLSPAESDMRHTVKTAELM